MAWFQPRTSSVREAAVAGTFYPRGAGELERQVSGFLTKARSPGRGDTRAIIAPHAGYVYSGEIAAEAFKALQPMREAIARAVVIGPAHFVPFRGIAAPSSPRFATPLGEMTVDRAAIADLADLPQVVIDDAPHAPDHALEVELPFLQAVLGDVPIVPLIVGGAGAGEVAEVLARLWDERTLVVVSSDLSHYHDYDTARGLDLATASAIEAFDEQAIGSQDACGHLAVRGMLIEAQRRGLDVARLDLRNSGDTAGDRSRVVGYGAWCVCERGATGG